MTSKRVPGNSVTRAAIIEAAEALMMESGYASVTSRNIAVRAGLKSNLVHYYFKTMDELFIALYHQVSERFLDLRRVAISSERPLRSLWEVIAEPDNLTIIYEFVALANHRKDVSVELAKSGKAMRDINFSIINTAINRKGLGWIPFFPQVFAIVFESAARTLTLHEVLGISEGNREVIRLIEKAIDFFDS